MNALFFLLALASTVNADTYDVRIKGFSLIDEFISQKTLPNMERFLEEEFLFSHNNAEFPKTVTGFDPIAVESTREGTCPRGTYLRGATVSGYNGSFMRGAEAFFFQSIHGDCWDPIRAAYTGTVKHEISKWKSALLLRKAAVITRKIECPLGYHVHKSVTVGDSLIHRDTAITSRAIDSPRDASYDIAAGGGVLACYPLNPLFPNQQFTVSHERHRGFHYLGLRSTQGGPYHFGDNLNSVEGWAEAFRVRHLLDSILPLRPAIQMLMSTCYLNHEHHDQRIGSFESWHNIKSCFVSIQAPEMPTLENYLAMINEAAIRALNVEFYLPRLRGHLNAGALAGHLNGSISPREYGTDWPALIEAFADPSPEMILKKMIFFVNEIFFTHPLGAELMKKYFRQDAIYLSHSDVGISAIEALQPGFQSRFYSENLWRENLRLVWNEIRGMYSRSP